MEILSFEECVDCLGQVPVGRIAITVEALPVILPVNFAFADDSIYFRTVPGTKLAAATSRVVVAFEVDSYESDGQAGWSVLVQGMARIVTDGPTLERIIRAKLDAWALHGEADHVVRLEMSTITGRRIDRQ